jgi:hypothetical protein
VGENSLEKHLFISSYESSGKLDILQVKIKEFPQVFNHLHIKAVMKKYIYDFLIPTACLGQANQLFLGFLKKCIHTI